MSGSGSLSLLFFFVCFFFFLNLMTLVMLRGIKLVIKIILKIRMVVQGQLVDPPFALVTYRHVKN